jgi:hypothetical protein
MTVLDLSMLACAVDALMLGGIGLYLVIRKP